MFTSFNQLFRIDPYTFDVWMRLLRRLPGSVLWIVHMPDDGVQNIYKEAVKRYGMVNVLLLDYVVYFF